MANQKNTDLRRMTVGQVAPGDLIPIVDVSEPTSPTGENKVIPAMDLAQYVAISGYAIPPLPAANPSNGLAFDGTFNVPIGADKSLFCYTEMPPISSSAFSLTVRAFFPSTRSYGDSLRRVVVGVGRTTELMTDASSSAYIAVEGTTLVGHYASQTGEVATITIPGFLNMAADKALHIILTKLTYPSIGLAFWINGVRYATPILTGTPNGEVSSSYLVVGNGMVDRSNIDATIFDVALRKQATTFPAEALTSYFRGESDSDPKLEGHWMGEQLSSAPSQWLDTSGHNRHLLLPISGAQATNARKKFSLRFTTTSSGYLGGDRDVLPPGYVLTGCVLESPGKPLISIGTSGTASFSGASVTGSWYDNRVGMTSASYGVNTLTVNTLGDVHPERKLFVQFHAPNTSPCTFSFDGYTR